MLPGKRNAGATPTRCGARKMIDRRKYELPADAKLAALSVCWQDITNKFLQNYVATEESAKSDSDAIPIVFTRARQT